MGVACSVTNTAGSVVIRHGQMGELAMVYNVALNLDLMIDMLRNGARGSWYLFVRYGFTPS